MVQANLKGRKAHLREYKSTSKALMQLIRQHLTEVSIEYIDHHISLALKRPSPTIT